MSLARDCLAAAERILRAVESTCREAGMDDDLGNVDVMNQVFNVCEEIESEGIRKLK